VLIAQVIFLLECGHTDTRIQMSLISLFHAVATAGM